MMDEDEKVQVRKEGITRGLIKLSRNRLSLIGAIFLLTAVLLALLAPWIAPYPEDAGGAVHFEKQLKPPSLSHLLGTDESGRDILSRLLYGARISLALAVVVLTLSLIHI